MNVEETQFLPKVILENLPDIMDAVWVGCDLKMEREQRRVLNITSSGDESVWLFNNFESKMLNLLCQCQ